MGRICNTCEAIVANPLKISIIISNAISEMRILSRFS